MDVRNVWETDTEEDSEVFHRPTDEEYEAAVKEVETLGRWIRESRRRQTELIDSLSIERENEKTYTRMYEKNKDIVRMYQICKEVDEQQANKGAKKRK